VKLESHLPGRLAPGCATAIFCFGHCFGLHDRVADLRILVDGVAHRPAAVRMPRRDLFEWIGGSDEDPEGRSYRSGFWATVPVRAPAAGTIELAAEVRLANSGAQTVSLGAIEVAPPTAVAWPGPAVSTDTIAICMATFDPDPALLHAQIQSLREQTDERWICLISDGGSSPERLRSLLALVQSDPRFSVSRAERRLGPYENFERVLRIVPPEVGLVAMCDQDDRWYREKLAVLRAELGSAELIYSDQRLIAPDGRVLRESLWQGRRNDRRNLASLLIANTVPGAAMLFRRRLLELALPFPQFPGVQYHDHWLALVALASGELSYVDRPLFDWVQHGAAASRGKGPARRTPGSRGWRGAYFGGYVPRELEARTLLLRCASRLTTRKRRALRWFIAAARSPVGFVWLALRPLRRLVGRDETLGGETALTRGVMWRWLIEIAVGRAEEPGRRPYDAAFPDPPRFEQRRLRRWRTGA
jgi:glycosyltransferase involved in cell wall biosynthesis